MSYETKKYTLISLAVAIGVFLLMTITLYAVKDSIGYENCSEAKANGLSHIRSTDPEYRAHLDGDGDKIACE